jgi:hypothetical protein
MTSSYRSREYVVRKIGIGWVSMKWAAKKRKKRERALKRMHRPHKKKAHARTTFP